MKCSRCGHRRPNEYCYVCREEEPPRETPDRDGGSLLKVRDRVSLCCGLALVAAISTLVILAACGCRDFEAYCATSMLAILAAFIAITNDD